jgi:hypothetical protein
MTTLPSADATSQMKRRYPCGLDFVPAMPAVVGERLAPRPALRILLFPPFSLKMQESTWPLMDQKHTHRRLFPATISRSSSRTVLQNANGPFRLLSRTTPRSVIRFVCSRHILRSKLPPFESTLDASDLNFGATALTTESNSRRAPRMNTQETELRTGQSDS